MYKIKISNLKFLSIIGILDYERDEPQNIEINFECFYKDKKYFINYMDIAEFLQSSMIKNKYELIEDAIDSICANLYKKYKNMQDISLEIIKLDVLDNGHVSISSK